jgi:heptaprenyl diphosphate synthase
MRLPPSDARMRRIARLALLAAFGLVLFVAEGFVGLGVPGLKLGLGNVATLVALYLYGVRAAAIVTAVRLIVGPAVIGTLLSPAFALSCAGAAASVVAMATGWWAFGRWLSPVGVSTLGAVAHSVAQWAAFDAIFVAGRAPTWWLSPLIALGIGTGATTGLLARATLGTLEDGET